MKKNRLPRNAVKEAFDNLPSGICYFGENGIPVLCNRQMHRLVFALTGRDLQQLTDLTDALEAPSVQGVKNDGDSYILPDGCVWRISSASVSLDKTYTEFVATNVTELYAKKKALEKSTAEHETMVANMRKIVDHVTDITREEEILTMKMQIHGSVGVALQRLRRYHTIGCPEDEKKAVISELENVERSLLGSIGVDDEVDSLAELLRIAAKLKVKAEIKGVMPVSGRIRDLIVMAIRECLTNTIRHAGGDSVTAEITATENTHRVKITNNGASPASPIIEGGGLTSLRRQIEKVGGTMVVEFQPRFALRIEVGIQQGTGFSGQDTEGRHKNGN